MKTASFTFSGDLPKFLPFPYRSGVYTIEFKGNQSVKHLIEAAGIPHTEVKRIEVNQIIVDFNYIVGDGDSIKVFPYIGIKTMPAAGEDPANHPEPVSAQFLLDNHLGKLAVYLRLLGFDCRYDNELDDNTLVMAACQEGLILLTRDRRLLMRRTLVYGYCVRSLMPEEQVREVLERYDLYTQVQPFHRCLICNHILEPIAKTEILDRLEPLTKKYFTEFHHCRNCDKIYWKGSHYKRMLEFIENLSLEIE